MIRLIVQTTSTGDAAHIGGPVIVSCKTFDAALPELQKFIEDWRAKGWGSAEVIGAEVIHD